VARTDVLFPLVNTTVTQNGVKEMHYFHLPSVNWSDEKQKKEKYIILLKDQEA